jgi:hypothetical protein
LRARPIASQTAFSIATEVPQATRKFDSGSAIQFPRSRTRGRDARPTTCNLGRGENMTVLPSRPTALRAQIHHGTADSASPHVRGSFTMWVTEPHTGEGAGHVQCVASGVHTSRP